ncbi:chain length determinant protein [Agaribacterium sp. ZY112]|uniref:chain length determinant protein n=1 Tax=Agaribacterium sp. ZY112 TaxID=3233574 RepID=UPI003526C09A
MLKKEEQIADVSSNNSEVASRKQDVSFERLPEMIDLGVYWGQLWQARYFITGMVLIFAIVGGGWALSLPNMYTSKGVYAASQKQDDTAMLGGQLGGIAAMAGINLGGGEKNDIDQALVLAASWPFIDEVINKHELAPLIMGVKRWDQGSGRFTWDESVYDSSSGAWVASIDERPTSFEIYKEFLELVGFSVNSKTGMVTISATHYSADVAERWVHILAGEINEHFQSRDILDAQKNIAYLNNKITETSIANMQSIFYGMVENQMKTLMLAEVGDEYLLREVVPPRAAELKSKPMRAVIVLVFTVIGGFLTCFLVILREMYRSSKG